MSMEEIESHVKQQSEQLQKQSEQMIRHDVRIGALEKIDERVTRLNNYFQICGILLLVLGIGSGWLTTRFLSARQEINRLTENLNDSKKLLDNQLAGAKKQFDEHVNANPVITALQAKVTKFDTAFATAGPTGDGVQTPKRRGDGNEGEDMITSPPGTYVYGIRVGWNKGPPHGVVHHVSLLYKPFLSSSP
ncbi:MAG: hypothetical protein WAO00_02410 [Chthoniobacterales bacterium]